MHMYIDSMKNEVAPTVCDVQSISFPSEIVLVDRHNIRHEIIDKVPNLFTLGSP